MVVGLLMGEIGTRQLVDDRESVQEIRGVGCVAGGRGNDFVAENRPCGVWAEGMCDIEHTFVREEERPCRWPSWVREAGCGEPAAINASNECSRGAELPVGTEGCMCAERPRGGFGEIGYRTRAWDKCDRGRVRDEPVELCDPL